MTAQGADGLEADDLPRTEADAVRLYNEGWSIRRVAEEFGADYDSMRRLLRTHVTLRAPGGSYEARVRIAERIAELDRQRRSP